MDDRTLVKMLIEVSCLALLKVSFSTSRVRYSIVTLVIVLSRRRHILLYGSKDGSLSFFIDVLCQSSRHSFRLIIHSMGKLDQVLLLFKVMIDSLWRHAVVTLHYVILRLRKTFSNLTKVFRNFDGIQQPFSS
jgi:hypothetical protein